MPNILIVDDDMDLRRLVRATLDTENHSIKECGNGEDAIELLTDLEGEWEADIVLLDVEMPRMCGWETLSIIKDVDDGWDCRVVMLTETDGLETATKAWTQGADFFVAKPFSIARFMAVIARAGGMLRQDN